MTRALPVLFVLALITAGVWLYLGRMRADQQRSAIDTVDRRDPAKIDGPRDPRPPAEAEVAPPERKPQVAPPAFEKMAMSTRDRLGEEIKVCDLPSGTEVQLLARVVQENGTLKVLSAEVTGPDGELAACARKLAALTWTQEGPDGSFAVKRKVTVP